MGRTWLSLSGQVGQIVVKALLGESLNPTTLTHGNPASHFAVSCSSQRNMGLILALPDKRKLVIVDGVHQVEQNLINDIRDQEADGVLWCQLVECVSPAITLWSPGPSIGETVA